MTCFAFLLQAQTRKLCYFQTLHPKLTAPLLSTYQKWTHSTHIDFLIYIPQHVDIYEPHKMGMFLSFCCTKGSKQLVNNKNTFDSVEFFFLGVHRLNFHAIKMYKITKIEIEACTELIATQNLTKFSKHCY